MAEYTRKPQLMVKKGMNVTFPGDRLGSEHFQYAKNIRPFKIGEWRQRGGMTRLYPAVGEVVKYITRLNNNIDGTFRRAVATEAGKVYFDNAPHNALVLSDSGYSALDFTSVISRPDRSPLSYLFVGNSQRQSKFSPVGIRTEWGLAAPTSPVSPFINNPAYFIDSSSIASVAGYVAVNGVIAAAGRVAVTNPTFVIPDNTFPGIASVSIPVPSANSDFQAGMVLVITPAPTPFLQTPYQVVVEDVFQPIVNTTIAAISYDSGTTGLCTIQLATPTTGLRKDSVVQIDAEGIRVLSVTDGLDGVPSFRCSTTVNHTVGAIVLGLRSFRAFFPYTLSLTDTISAGWVQITTSAAGIASATLTFAGGPINLASAANRPMQPEDLIHLSVSVQDWSKVVEIQVQFDCDISTNDFTRNYFFKSIRPPDFQGAIAQTSTAITAQQSGIAKTQIDDFTRQQIEQDQFFSDPYVDELGNAVKTDDRINRTLGSGFNISSDQGPISGQATPGKFQTTELFIPVSEFQRVGGDTSRGWSDIVKFRVSMVVQDAIVILFESLWVGGTFGPNTVELPGYDYVVRARNTSTGSRSNPSPPTRSPILPKRQAVYIQAPTYPDSQADIFDFYRIGGTVAEYHYVGSTTAGNLFQDSIPDSIARRNPLLETDRFKPWPRSDLPKSGTCNVIGTRIVWVSGDTFNTAWARGTLIIIKDRVYSLYTNPLSTTVLDLNESAGAQTNVPFQIPDPQMDSQPMAAVFGPFSGASGEFLFGCGDPSNPGFLYWTNANDPESASDANYIELCGPSEKLVSGVVLDGLVYCFSDKRSWRILPSFQGGQTAGGSDFYPQETAMGKGLAGISGICVGDAIYYVSFDGIYRSRGDVIESLTDEGLAPLFNRDGTFVTDFVVPASPVDFSMADDISLTYSYDGIYFTYRGRDSLTHTFYYSFLSGGWVEDTLQTGAINRSSREVRSIDADNVIVGTSDGKVMIRSNSVFLDDADPISCRIWDREEIWDDIRLTKQVGDVMFDVDPANATLTPTLRYESNLSNDVLSNITGNGRDQFVRDVNSGSGRITRGVALDLTWSNGTSATPRIYAWEPAALVKPEESVNRATDWDGGGYTGTKWLQGFRLRGDTLGVQKSFQVEADGGALVEAFNFTANGEQVVTFWLTTPAVGHEFRIRGTDGDLWRNMGVEWIFEPEPEQAAVWETQVTSFDLPFFHHMREVMIAHRSTADITMTVSTDGAVTNTYTIPHGGGNRIRSYLSTKGIKTKFTKFRFTSPSPFGLWIKDIECRVGAWGRTDSYTVQRPFGDISRSNGGARI